MGKSVIIAVLFLALPVLAAAQRHVMGAAPLPAMRVAPAAPFHGAPAPGGQAFRAPAGHPVGHPLAPAPGATPAVSTVVTPVAPHVPQNFFPQVFPPVYPDAGGFFIPFGQQIPNAPGFGFDYEHYFAVYPAARYTPINSGLYVPFIGGGYYMPYPVSYPENAAPAAEQTAQAAAPETQQQVWVQAPQRETAPSEPAGPTVFSKTDKLPEFTFLRTDGTVFFAVAYSFTKNHLRYITQDGVPKSVLLTSLDLSASREFNEERGIQLRIPN